MARTDEWMIAFAAWHTPQGGFCSEVFLLCRLSEGSAPLLPEPPRETKDSGATGAAGAAVRSFVLATKLCRALSVPRAAMVNGRGPLHGDPSGLRMRVPLAGMPLRHGIRNSGQVPLPTWASIDMLPSEWMPPEPSFEEDAGRQKELARLLVTLKQLPPTPDAAVPTVLHLAETELNDDELSELDISKLWPELDMIESQAAQRQATLQRIRAHLQNVAHGETGVRTRLRRDESSNSLSGKGESEETAPPTSDRIRDGGKSAPPPPRDVKREGSPEATAPPAAPPSYRYTGVQLKMNGQPGVMLRPAALPPTSRSVTPVGDADAGAVGSTGGKGVGDEGLRAAAAAARQAHAASGGGSGSTTAGKSATARRAAQQAQAKAAQAQREREELGEAAGYTSLRIKPNSSIAPKQFWSAVDEYMRPLPRQPPPRPPPPLPLPDRTPITDRLLAALLPVPAPAAADGADTHAAGSAANGAAPMKVDPEVALKAAGGRVGGGGGGAVGGGGAAAGGGGSSLPPEQLERRLRSSLVTLGLLGSLESERPPVLQSDGVGDELRRLQEELIPLAAQNAKDLETIHRRAQAACGAGQKERIHLASVTKGQQRLRQQQQRAPKRKKGESHQAGGSHHAAAAVAAGDAALGAVAAGYLVAAAVE